MFDKKTYVERRNALKKRMSEGLVWILGNSDAPMNYPGNPYHFRQDSTFLYYFGIDKAGFSGLIDLETGVDYLIGEDFTIDDIIWMGTQPTVQELGALSGITQTGDTGFLKEKLAEANEKNRKIHYLPPYRTANKLLIEEMTGIPHPKISEGASIELVQAVVAQRSFKSPEEVAEIEKALDISHEMIQSILKNIRPGRYEREIVGLLDGVIGSHGSHASFPIILTIHGETLHNHDHSNRMNDGDLLIVDSGAESPEYYASDITRTFPVSGKFSPEQRDIYQIVLNSQIEAIRQMKPGVSNRDIHLSAAGIMVDGLKDMGLMKGDTGQAVEAGAHALFFPHGLGHMMGLDVHDMEDIGENHVGYDSTVQRSEQFGLAYLRLARELQPGFVLTVEPGIYFIPALIDQWRSENKHRSFIDYDRVEQFKGFGGIRIEDDVLITPEGHRVLGNPIPKTIEEIENEMAR